MLCGHTRHATSTWLPSFLRGEVCEMFCTRPFCFPGNLEMKKCCHVAAPPVCSRRTEQRQLWQCRAIWPLVSLLRLRSRSDACNALTHTQEHGLKPAKTPEKKKTHISGVCLGVFLEQVGRYYWSGSSSGNEMFSVTLSLLTDESWASLGHGHRLLLCLLSAQVGLLAQLVQPPAC